MRPLTVLPALVHGLAGFATVCAVGLLAAGPLEAKATRVRAHHSLRHSTHYAHRSGGLMTPTTVALQRQDQKVLAPAVYAPDRVPTAFTYQIAREGPVGSVGFQRPAMDPWGQSQDASRGLASSLHLDRPESTFGAKLTVPLK